MSTDSLLLTALTRILVELFSSLSGFVVTAGLLTWDFGLMIYNKFAQDRPANHVTPEGRPGANGLWPRYVPPRDGDSRCCCPGLNAMANHGILPHSGRNITFTQLTKVVHETYNFAPSFSCFASYNIATTLCRNYWTDTLDLADINVHNGIEHDASLTREDTFIEPDQGKPSVRLIEKLLAGGTGPKGNLTIADLSRISGQRRVESKMTNSQFSLSFTHKVMFGSANASNLVTIFGGKIDDLRPFLLEERIPDNWQPRVTHPMGITIAEFNTTVLRLELGIKEELPPSLGFGGDVKQKGKAD